MKKALVALAVAGVVAPVAQADNVVIYGRLNTAGQYTKIQDGAKDTTVANQNSRFGLKGEEKIGSLTAEFQIENGFDSTTGGDGLASRDTFVGLKGDFGRVRLGKNETPTWTLFDTTVAKFHHAGIADVTATGTGGTPRAGSLSAVGDLGSRFSKSVIYRTPDFGGIVASVQAADATTTYKRLWDGSITYGNGATPITAGLAVRSAKTIGGNEKNDNIYVLAGKFKQDLFDVSAAYERDDYKSTDTKINKAFLSGQYNMGNAALVGSLGWAGKAKVAGTSVNDSNAIQYILGAQYDLSNRTQVYGYYTKLDNKNAATYSFVSATPVGKDNQGVVLGVRHNF
ncbi:MAG: porin [Pseudomonadota bacterium]